MTPQGCYLVGLSRVRIGASDAGESESADARVALSNGTFHHLGRQPGHWWMDLEPPFEATPFALGRIADHATSSFVGAFAGLYRPIKGRGKLTTLDERGAVVDRAAARDLIEMEGWRFRPPEEPALPQNVFVDKLLVHCDVVIEPADDRDEPIVVPGAGRFGYESGLETGDTGWPTFRRPVARVSSWLDVWLDVTHDPEGPGAGRDVDNRALGRRNRPRLESALRRWEAAMAKPITHFVSPLYPDRVGRYGYYSESELPPAPFRPMR